MAAQNAHAAASDRVTDLRLRRDARAELEWFFEVAETELEAPSNFGRMLASVSPEGYSRTPEDQLEAAVAHGTILRWLRAMPNNEAGVLQVAYEPCLLPRVVRKRFGRLAGVAVRLTCRLDEWPEERRLQEEMDRAKAEKLALKCTSGKHAKFLRRLEERAKERFERALAAYVAVRGARSAGIPERAWGAF